MTQRFQTVTLIGVGLLGGSLGLALKERGLAGTVRGVGRRQSSLDTALEMGAIDEGMLSLKEGVVGADLVVICTPANAVTDTLDVIRSLCGKDTVVTDVASTKAVICKHAHERWSAPYSFIGSHPMAGSEKFGPEHARADLYDGAITLVEAPDNHLPEAHAAVVQLWESVGSKVIRIDPAHHDECVARTSHIPHVVAAALAQYIQDPEEVQPFIGNGFRDTTRVAEGRPELWRDICLTNPDAITQGVRTLIDELVHVSEAIENGDADALDDFFENGVQARRTLLDS
ncbi:MAG: prephenate dehydrogenase/arogenate dehydrogenase family protein [Candidatus Hydrogenedentota bacterium]